MNDIIKLTYQREGEEIKTMEFEQSDIRSLWRTVLKAPVYSIYFDHETFSYQIFHLGINKDRGSIIDQLHPLYLEFITQEECPICKGAKEILIVHSGYTRKDCPNCTDGRIEKITGKYTFNPKDAE